MEEGQEACPLPQADSRLSGRTGTPKTEVGSLQSTDLSWQLSYGHSKRVPPKMRV